MAKDTYWPEQVNTLPSEAASSQFGSGGGFSVRVPQAEHASWQHASTQHFLNNMPAPQQPQNPYSRLPPRGRENGFDPAGRGTPDVAVVGEGFQVLQDGPCA